MRIRTYQITGDDFIFVFDRVGAAAFEVLKESDSIQKLKEDTGAVAVVVFNAGFGDIELGEDDEG